MATLAITRLAEVFTMHMADEASPTLCPSCLHDFSVSLHQKSNSATVDRMVVSHPSFWTACAAVASSAGESTDLTALRRVLIDNAAACRDRTHATGGWDVVGRLMDDLCSCIHLALCRGPNAKTDKVFLGVRGAWPRATHDAMPRGIAPYARWACVLPTGVALALVARLTETARIDVFSGLCQSPARDCLVSGIVRALRNWDVPEDELPAPSRPYLLRGVGLAEPPDADVLAYTVCSFIHAVYSGADRRLQDWPRICVGYDVLLYDAIVGRISNLPSFKEIDFKPALCLAASTIQAMNPELDLPDVVEQFRDRYTGRPGPVELVYAQLHMRSYSRVCSLAGCTNMTSHAGNGRLQVCGRCKFSHYCSKECQRLDWKEPPLSHRDLCPALLAVVPLIKEGIPVTEFTRRWSEESLLDVTQKILLVRFALRDT